jgi:PAS domain S-box-containing protein
MLGRPRDELLRLTVADVTHPEDLAPSVRALGRVIETGAPASLDKRYVRPDGALVWANSSLNRLDDAQGAPEFILAVTIDLSARKLAEQELAEIRGNLERRVGERTAELDRVNQALREEIEERHRMQTVRHDLLRQLEGAQEAERGRLSRELHDQVGQHLTALMLGLKALGSQVPPGAPGETIRTLLEIAETISHELHEIALTLRPTALDDLGLVRVLGDYAAKWAARANVKLAFESTGLERERLPLSVEITLYRIAVEALNNVLKHARARHVGLILKRLPDHVRLIVEDDGVGFDPPPPGRMSAPGRIGLLGMHERALLHGGHVAFESAPGQGATVFVLLPLPAAPAGPPPWALSSK